LATSKSLRDDVLAIAAATAQGNCCLARNHSSIAAVGRDGKDFARIVPKRIDLFPER